MSLRINYNVPAIKAHKQLVHSDKLMSKSLERLSSGLKINKAKDGPANLVISEQLRAQISSLNEALENNERASNIINVAEGSLDQITTLLKQIRVLILEAINTGAMDENQIQANQDEIDAAISSIDRVINTCKFGVKKLLDGTQSYIIASTTSSALKDINIRNLKFDTASAVTINIQINASAAVASANITVAANQTADSVVKISGKEGSEVFTFASGMTASEIRQSINMLADTTGVIASTDGDLYSRDYGDDAFVSIEVLEGTFNGTYTRGDKIRDYGQDISATVEGVQAAASGSVITLASDFFTGEIEFDPTVVESGIYSIKVQRSGMLFQLGGNTTSDQQIFLGIEDLRSTNLGRAQTKNGETGYLYTLKSGQAHSLKKDPETALEIVDYAIENINKVRAQLGAFQKDTLEKNISSLRVTSENLIASESRIRDVDFAEEIMNFVRSQILVQSGTSVLAQANTSIQSVLQLLG